MLGKPFASLALATAFAAAACSVGRDRDSAGAPTRPAAEAPAAAVAATGAAPSGAAPSGAAPTGAAPSGAAAEPGERRRPLRPGEMRPDLARKADEVLEAHGAQAIGTEVPFERNGRRYVARIEEHYRDPADGAAGPTGAHKGVTLYAIDLERIRPPFA